MNEFGLSHALFAIALLVTCPPTEAQDVPETWLPPDAHDAPNSGLPPNTHDVPVLRLPPDVHHGLVRPEAVVSSAPTISGANGGLAFGTASLAETSAGIAVAPAQGDTIVITSVGVELSYDIKEIRASAGDTLAIRYDNSISDMTHNFVLVGGEIDILPVGNAALDAYRNDYIPEDELERIIAHSPLVYPGETVTFSFVVPPPGSYPYICTYSGHFTMMQGRLISHE